MSAPPSVSLPPAGGDSSNPFLRRIDPPDATDLDCNGLKKGPFCVNPSADAPERQTPRAPPPDPSPDVRDVPPPTPTVPLPTPFAPIPHNQCREGDPSPPDPTTGLQNPLGGATPSPSPSPSDSPQLTMPTPPTLQQYNQPPPIIPPLDPNQPPPSATPPLPSAPPQLTMPTPSLRQYNQPPPMVPPLDPSAA
jgi:hypothetical protein